MQYQEKKARIDKKRGFEGSRHLVGVAPATLAPSGVDPLTFGFAGLARKSPTCETVSLMVHDHIDDGPFEEGRGRSARKREVKAIADLAKRLVDSSNLGVTTLPWSDELRTALMQVRTSKGSARKRQLKFFTRLLREDEQGEATARTFLDGVDQNHLGEVRDFKKLEKLRDDLIDPELFAAAMKRACDELPTLDRREISSLARAAHKNPGKRHSRAIFRCLRDASEQ